MSVFRTIIASVTDGIIRTFIGTGEAGGTIQGEIIQQVGIKSHPKPGDSGLVIQDGDRVYMIATDNDLSPPMVEGERVLAYDANNFVKFEVVGGVLQKIHVLTQKDVDIQATGNVTITAPIINLGLAGVVSLVTSVFLALFNLHTHKESGGGETLLPTQQAPLAGNTTANVFAS